MVLNNILINDIFGVLFLSRDIKDDKNNTLVSGNAGAGDEKNIYPGRKFILLFDILFSSLVSFTFLHSCCCCFFCLFVCFFEIKNTYSDTHSTMRAGGDKNFSPDRFPETKLLFFGLKWVIITFVLFLKIILVSKTDEQTSHTIVPCWII